MAYNLLVNLQNVESLYPCLNLYNRNYLCNEINPHNQVKMEGMKEILADKLKPLDPKRPDLLDDR